MVGRSAVHSFLVLAFLLVAFTSAHPQVWDESRNVTYQGTSRKGIDSFLNIPFGQDTVGARRFAAPEPFVPTAGTIFNNTQPGSVCPQDATTSTVYRSNATDQSEDCLNLLVVKPSFAVRGWRLPVMVYIYGGGLRNGQAYERTQTGQGLVHQSMENGLPVLYVAMNYRLTIFGFALSEALRDSHDLNAGLRDQRLALEWVRDNIEWFGGDPDRVTIFGQSSGGLSVATQVLAYGGSKEAPFQRAICESTALEPGMTSNITLDSFNGVAYGTGCVQGDPQSSDTLECLRALPMETLLNITLTQANSNSSVNAGDVYLPTVDGDFLPAPASELIRTGRFTPVPFIGGWTMDDFTLFTPTTITTEAETLDFVSTMYPSLTNASLSTILTLYPTSSFPSNTTANLSSEFYRTAQIGRDILLTCPNFYLGHAISQHHKNFKNQTRAQTGGKDAPKPSVYYYVQNQTIFTPYLTSRNKPGLGITHASELPYVYGDLTVFNTSAFQFHPKEADYALARRQSRSWSTFAYFGKLVERGQTFKGWSEAYAYGRNGGGMMDAKVFVIGGSEEGISGLGGKEMNGNANANANTNVGVEMQMLRERCGFFNSKEVIEQLNY
ncbi:Alpha/Beta hydrolase protein [Rhexocercosporidium sp. MPI-PUGE-AT-0058]|nr:Alpha/Beta hydrolase protein [Rhexocercosporidium sp. MPI-PUGE-AT-0058]